LTARCLKIWQGFRSKVRLETIAQVERPFRPTRVLDVYILKEYLLTLLITVASCVIIFTVFSLFEILDEIFKNRIPWSHVMAYYLFVWPMIISLVLPLCILIALLICFGLLEKSNQIMALKACGISLYRIASPVAVLGVILGIGIFAMQEFILPFTNQRQDALYNEIKGRKVQTVGPDVTWIMGGDGRIYNYRHFDYRQKVFADLSIYGIDLSAARISWRYYAPSARWEDRIRRWVLINGWARDFSTRSPALSHFTTLAADLKETPAYFKTEVKQSNKMSYAELSDYITKLKKGGFDTLSLEVDLYSKIAYPAVNFIMLLIGLPFAFKMGKRGALFGMAVSILLGIMFWALFNLFTAMGGYGILPPLLAAWAPNLFFGFGGFYLALNIRT
jgi:LPS export ABC transporter permease LptG